MQCKLFMQVPFEGRFLSSSAVRYGFLKQTNIFQYDCYLELRYSGNHFWGVERGSSSAGCMHHLRRILLYMMRNSHGNQIIFLQISSQLRVILPLKGAFVPHLKNACLSQVGGVVASSGWKLGIPLKALHCRGQGTTKNCLTENVSRTKMEKPCSRRFEEERLSQLSLQNLNMTPLWDQLGEKSLFC